MEENDGQWDRAIVSKEQPENVSVMMTKTVTTEKDVELKPSLLFSTSIRIAGGKSARHLTEAEKEAQRLRRVLANRESARQTIRRRQAMFKELTRKAVHLELENENLKKDKELAVKEYDSLKRTNDCLKAEMAKTMMVQAEETVEKSNSSRTETYISVFMRNPSFPYNQASMMAFHYPPMVQSLDPVFQQSTSESGIATLIPVTQMWMPNLSIDHGNLAITANPGTLLYALPFSCFLPYHAPIAAFHPQSSELNDKQNENSMDPLCSVICSSKRGVQVSSYQSSSSPEVNIEASNLTKRTSVGDHMDIGFGFPPDGGGEGEVMYCTNMVLKPTPLSCVRPVASVGPFTSLHLDDTCHVDAIASAASLTAEGNPEENQEPVVKPTNEPTDAIAAAEARKRRKELIKLKNLQANQY